LYFTYKLPGHCKPSELVTDFDSAYPTDTMKPGRARYAAEGRQDEFDLYFDPDRRNLCCEHKHSSLANIHAVSGVVVLCSVGPAK
jgi:hypothetical protein